MSFGREKEREAKLATGGKGMPFCEFYIVFFFFLIWFLLCLMDLRPFKKHATFLFFLAETAGANKSLTKNL